VNPGAASGPQPGPALVRWLDPADPPDEAEVGGKLGRLAGLARAGFAVPAGFAVTVAAHRAGAGPVRAAVTGAYRRLGDLRGEREPLVAVRSSAAGEDGPAASFAGGFDTVLGVRGGDAVLAAVRQCWDSLDSARARAYRIERNLAVTPMAVGVMELVPAYCSGVAFSAHPVTGRRDRMVIEANFGWGEAVVRGAVVPDHLEVSRPDGRVVRRMVGHKTVRSELDPAGGTVLAPMPAELRDRPVLGDAAVGTLAVAVAEAERLIGGPADVEWVFDGPPPAGRLWIVQARPITAGL
jgi:pyruvate,water dikinase